MSACAAYIYRSVPSMVYSKPNIRRAEARHHVDVFAVTESVVLDDELVFHSGAWQVKNLLEKAA